MKLFGIHLPFILSVMFLLQQDVWRFSSVCFFVSRANWIPSHSVPYHFNDTCRLPPREASKKEALVILVLLTVDCSNTFENKKQTFVTIAHQLTLNDLRQHTRQTAIRAVFRSNTTIKLFVFGFGFGLLAHGWLASLVWRLERVKSSSERGAQ